LVSGRKEKTRIESVSEQEAQKVFSPTVEKQTGGWKKITRCTFQQIITQ
jgi:hypothetical protein